MTREEAIRCLSVHSSTNGSGLCTDEQHYKAKQMAIQALSQEPCDDAINRDFLFRVLDNFCGHDRTATITLDTLADIAYELPPVTQKPIECKDVVSREDAIRTLRADTLFVCTGDKMQAISDIEGLLPVTQKSSKDMPCITSEEMQKCKDMVKKYTPKQQPCDDAISRILKRMWNCRGKHTTSIDKVAMEQIIRDELPPVTQKGDVKNV